MGGTRGCSEWHWAQPHPSGTGRGSEVWGVLGKQGREVAGWVPRALPAATADLRALQVLLPALPRAQPQLCACRSPAALPAPRALSWASTGSVTPNASRSICQGGQARWGLLWCWLNPPSLQPPHPLSTPVCVCWCSAVLAHGRGAHPQPVPSLAHAARSSSPPRAPSDPRHSHPPRFSSTLLQEPPRRAHVAPWGSRGRWPGGTRTRPPPASPRQGYAPGVSFQNSESCSFSRASCCFTTSALSDSHFLQGNRSQSTAPGACRWAGGRVPGWFWGAGAPGLLSCL